MNLGARAAALGGAYIAQTLDVASMYWNPGSIMFLQRESVVENTMFATNYAVMHTSVASRVYSDSRFSVAAGFAGTYFGTRWYDPNFTSRGGDICVATKLSPVFSVGMLVNVRYAQSSTNSLWASSGSVGVIYYPTPDISYGLVYEGFGKAFVYNNSPSQLFSLVDEHIPRDLKVGTSFYFPPSSNRVTFVIAMSTELSLSDRTLRNSAGFEYYPVAPLALRLGFANADSTTVTSFGFGIRLNVIQFDYAFVPMTPTDRYHQLSISISLGRAI